MYLTNDFAKDDVVALAPVLTGLTQLTSLNLGPSLDLSGLGKDAATAFAPASGSGAAVLSSTLVAGRADVGMNRSKDQVVLSLYSKRMEG